MSKTTDKDIVRVLKVCAKNETQFCCGECELGKNNSSCDCVDRLLKLSLDLINRQQKQLDNYSHNVRNMAKDFIDQQKIIQEQQAEIERLIGDVTTYKLRWAKATAKVETAKSEAIKEFAERLKGTIDLDTFGKLDYAISIYDVDNLVKEMVGEGK